MSVAVASAQQAQAPAKQPYGGGTPLDVILHTKLWVDPPPMRPFVRAARPPESSLHYTPTSGTEPKRPPLKTAAQLQQMENQLEAAGARDDRIAGFKDRYFKAARTPKTQGKTKRR